MRKFVFTCIFFIPVVLLAQGIAITNDGSAPDNTAMLDVKSNSKGILIPRLTTAERIAIVSPAIGLTVFDSETVSYWMFRGDIHGGWSELQHNYQNFWSGTGAHIYNKNAGNVGIGTNAPASTLTINDNNPVLALMNNGLSNSYIQADGANTRFSTGLDNAGGKLLLGTKGNDHFSIDGLGRVGVGTASDFDAEFKLNGISPRFALLQNGIPVGLIRPLANNLKLGTYPGVNGGIIFSPKGVDKIWIDEDGQMGIGTAAPVSELTVNGSSPVIELQQSGVNKGFIQALGNNLKLGTNSTNTTGNLVLQTKLLDRLTIDENGLVGIGTGSPSSALTINGNDPILQLRNNNVDKGFVQLVDDDIRVGTNISNPNGKFMVRTNGVDRFTIDEDGNGFLGNGVSGGNLFVNGPFGSVYFQSGNLTAGAITATQDDLDIHRTSPGIVRVRASSDGMWFYPNGQVSLGQGPRATGYLLSIEGKAIATEFRVLAIASWPDYVFSPGYRLRSLPELKQFIEKNKHLPGIPSAATVEQDGIALGDMSKRLLEKVEELTLYILKQQEEIEALKKQMQASGKN